MQNATMEGEQLRLELERLQQAIDELDVVPPESLLQPSRDDGEALIAAATLKQKRLDLQQEMEVAYHRLAEIEELEYVERVKRESVESGKIVTPMMVEDLGECPLCLQDIPPMVRFDEQGRNFGLTSHALCCGAKCCMSCFKKFGEHHAKVAKNVKDVEAALDTLALTGELSEPLEDFTSSTLASQRAELMASGRCPFCRLTLVGAEAKIQEKLVQHATAGKVWAQFYLAHEHFRRGAFANAVHWMELAAQQGSVEAHKNLCQIWANGSPSNGAIASVPAILPSPEKALAHQVPAARHGCAEGQFLCGNDALSVENVDEAKMWFYLAASQGYPMAQASVVAVFFQLKEAESDELNLYKRIYWLRQAALRNEPMSQEALSETLLLAKQRLFGSCDIAGYSALPEAAFWFDTAGKTSVIGRPYSAPPAPLRKPPELDVKCCAGCQTAGSDDTTATVRLRKCTKCRAVAYCGRECQAQHWNMGHKVDCKGVDKWRKALKEMTTKMASS